MTYNLRITSFCLAPFSLGSLIRPLVRSGHLLGLVENMVIKEVPWEGVRVLPQPSKFLVVYTPYKRVGVGLCYSHDPGDIGEKSRGLSWKFLGVNGRVNGKHTQPFIYIGWLTRAGWSKGQMGSRAL